MLVVVIALVAVVGVAAICVVFVVAAVVIASLLPCFWLGLFFASWLLELAFLLFQHPWL